MPGIRRTLAVYSSRPDEVRTEAARVLAECRDVPVTQEHGIALRYFLRCAHATVWVVGPRSTPVQHVLAAIASLATDAIVRPRAA